MKEAVKIGLCGRSGTGKGHVSKKFALLGIPAVDTDAVYRTLTAAADVPSPCMEELIAAFGGGIRNPDNSLNRRALAAIVFAEGGGEALAQLNQITHKHILAETVRIADQLAENGAEFVLIDAPVLFESGFDTMCRFTLCVVASEETSVARILNRDGVSEEEARRRLASQIPNEELLRRCDFHIINELRQDDVPEQVRAVTEEIRARLKGGAL